MILYENDYKCQKNYKKLEYSKQLIDFESLKIKN